VKNSGRYNMIRVPGALKDRSGLKRMDHERGTVTFASLAGMTLTREIHGSLSKRKISREAELPGRF
jgi:hypothetical protein